jgi:Mg-chelatase subunit ChlD
MSNALKTLCGCLALVTALFLGSGTRADGPVQKGEPAQKIERPEVEVVFCLDTTGSMGGLIDAAKKKIWAISNQIAGGTPTPRLKVGLVAYRDRGDEYVTRITPLTDDLDAIHTQLMSFVAAGGGDFPESVNQALHEAVTKIKWSPNKKTLKIIFLVGDAPPHMDYPDDVKYPETCKLTLHKDIIINTIQCGNHAQTKEVWLKICRSAEGSYVQIDARGGPVVVVKTPFDNDLAKINAELCKTTLCFGDDATQKAGEKQKAVNQALPKAVQADRAAFYANSKRGASYDLLENIQNKKVKLEELKKEQLPPELRNLTLAEQRAFLDKLDKQRTELNQQARELDKKRAAYITKKQAEDAKNQARDSFDNQVLRILQRQANRVNIQYEVDEKKK